MKENASLPVYYQIGEVARRVGVSIRTVRFYEEKGLLEAPDRTSGGMRLYDDRDVSRIKLIRRLRNVGLDLDEIKGALVNTGGDNDATRRSRIEHTLAVLRLEAERSRKRMAELQRESEEREAVIAMVSQCRVCGLSPCPTECPPQKHIV